MTPTLRSGGSMIGIARATLLALAACLTLLCPLAAQTPVLTEAAPASGARARKIRLGKIPAGGADRTGDRARARRHPDRNRRRGFAAARAGASGALARHDEDLLHPRWPSARPRRDARPARPRRHACRN